MKKYFSATLLFTILITGCVKNNRIDFTSSKAFFSSLNETKIIQKIDKEIVQKNKEIIQKEDRKSASLIISLKKNKIDKKNERKIKKSFLLNLASYEKVLRQKFGIDEYTILKIFNRPNLKINHGKIKNFQFHLKSCHLDLFLLYEGQTYKFRHFDIRPPSISSSLNKDECVKDLNSNFILIHDLK